MQKTYKLSFKLFVLALIICLIFPLINGFSVKAEDLAYRLYDFEDGYKSGWYSPWSGTTSVTNERAHSGSKSLKITGRQNTWDSPALNIYNIIKQGGAGVYYVQMEVLADKLIDGGKTGYLLIRGREENSFITKHGNNYYYKITPIEVIKENEWHTFVGVFAVTSSDISDQTGVFNLCFDFIKPVENQNIYIDDIQIVQDVAHEEPFTITPSHTTLYPGERIVLDLNRHNNLTFTSSNPSVATVDGNGIVRGVSSGTATITAKYYNTETATCVIDVNANGVVGEAFIKNVRINNYAQLDNNGKVIVEAWAFDGGQDQRWNFSYVGDGYYKITSIVSGNAITVADTDNANKALKVLAYTGENTQKWRIEKLDNGNYKIIPKVAIDSNIDWSMAVGEGIGADGRNVEYRNYGGLAFKDKGQWKIETYSVMLYSVEKFGHDHSSALRDVKTLFQNKGVYSVAHRSGSFSALECKQDLHNNNIFTSRSHGTYVYSGETSITLSTGIVLNNKTASSEQTVVLYSHQFNNMPQFSGYIDNDENFEGVHIAMFIGCETARGGVNGQNLASRVVALGAMAAIGFEQSILCNDANEWTELVYEQLLEGKTLNNAVKKACEAFPENSEIQSVVVCGDGDITLY
ncbi:MAG: hypothetical protein E7365_02700 [Clostridiales bacterium]|nr:hypothetical protein [Clostridiales bacterium]